MPAAHLPQGAVSCRQAATLLGLSYHRTLGEAASGRITTLPVKTNHHPRAFDLASVLRRAAELKRGPGK
jgi:hypothetical protein